MPYKDRNKRNKCKKRWRDNNKERISWVEMKYRCLNPNRKSYKYWGGRGIKVCDRWLGKNGFENFIIDMGIRPEGMTLDRIDNNGNYTPENCRWADKFQQNNNKRDNRLLTYKNKTQTIAEWAKELDMKYYLIYNRLRSGWSVKKTLETPVGN